MNIFIYFPKNIQFVLQLNKDNTIKEIKEKITDKIIFEKIPHLWTFFSFIIRC